MLVHKVVRGSSRVLRARTRRTPAGFKVRHQSGRGFVQSPTRRARHGSRRRHRRRRFRRVRFSLVPEIRVNPWIREDVPEQTVIVPDVPSKLLRLPLPRVLQIRPDRPGPIPNAHEQPIAVVVVVWLFERDDAFASVVLTHSVPVFRRETTDVFDGHLVVSSTASGRIGIVVVVMIITGRIIHRYCYS